MDSICFRGPLRSNPVFGLVHSELMWLRFASIGVEPDATSCLDASTSKDQTSSSQLVLLAFFGVVQRSAFIPIPTSHRTTHGVVGAGAASAADVGWYLLQRGLDGFAD